MRRSLAPSMINKSKRSCNNLDNHPESDPEDEPYKWGSKDNPTARSDECLDKNKRVFNIVWRHVTNKKHKTWKGDGILEVNIQSMKAILKDETGKYMGCTTKFKISTLQEDYQMVISGKEIEIQNEIKDEEQIYELRKRQMENRNWGSEEWISPEQQAEENKKPKGGFHFKPVLVLNPPKAHQSSVKSKTTYRDTDDEEKWGTTTYRSSIIPQHEMKYSDNISEKAQSDTKDLKLENYSTKEEGFVKRSNKEKADGITLDFEKASTLFQQYYKHQDFMCFIKPSELQQYIFQQINEYYTKHKANLNAEQLNSLNIQDTLEQICNHPSFIKHTPTTNKLAQFLTTSLPVWSDMGPFDSAKLEFVQYFVQPSGGKVKENVIIIAESLNALNMLQGLCDFMNLRCLRILTNDSKDTKAKILKEYLNKAEENITKVLLTTSIRNITDCGSLLENQQLLVFENIPASMTELKHVDNLKLSKVYYLVTAFSIEECLILPSYQSRPCSISLEDVLNLYNNDFEDPFCYVHSKIECNCCKNIDSSVATNEDFEFFKNWQHLAAPFEEQFLKDAYLENSSENLVTIFSIIQY